MRTQGSRRIQFVLLAGLCQLVHASFALSTADEDASRLLSTTRFREHAYGLSLLPPQGAKLFVRIEDDSVPWTLGSTGPKQVAIQDLTLRLRVQPIREQLLGQQENRDLLGAIANRRSIVPRTGAQLLSHSLDDAVLRMEGDIGYTIRLYIKRHSGVHITKVAEIAMSEVGLMYRGAIFLREQKLKLADREGVLLYYKLPTKSEGPTVLGHALLPIYSESFVLLRLDAPFVMFDDVRPTFTAVLDSLQIPTPEELDRQRKESLQRGRQWLGTLSTDQLHKAAHGEQLLRIVQGASDIGYMKVTARRSKELGLEGLAVIVGARVYEGETAYDTDSRFFLSNDGTHELWKINTTARLPRHRKQSDRSDFSWAETGFRFEDRIEVTRLDTAAPAKSEWQVPDGYISQVAIHLMDPLLPRDQDEIGFYAYLPSANKMTYRAVRAVSHEDGYRVMTRPSPQRGVHLAQYSGDNTLQIRLLPGGRLLIPTTGNQLSKRWHHDLSTRGLK